MLWRISLTLRTTREFALKFLLTNDDGIDAPGLAALEDALGRATGDNALVTVAAPHRGYSGCGHLVTGAEPIEVEEVSPRRFKIHGAPADCTRLGVLECASDTQIVLSGINEGGNVGTDMFMSGTVAAVREAGWLGVPGVAISQYLCRPERNWEKTTQMAVLVLQKLLAEPITGKFFNVNLPDVDTPAEDIPMVQTFAEPKHLKVGYRKNENGHYCMNDTYRNRPRTPGSDVDVCFGGSISICEIPWTTNS